MTHDPSPADLPGRLDALEAAGGRSFGLESG
jgi:hypothetical protein